MKTYNTRFKSQVLFITLAIVLISQLSYGKGLSEILNKNKSKNTEVSDVKNFTYTTIASNEGLLYIFRENIALPEEAVSGKLIIQDVSSMSQHISNFNINLNTDNKFEFVLNAPQNVFYPLIPQLATLTLFDRDENPIRSNHTNFSAGLVLKKEIESIPNLLILDPIILSNSDIELNNSEWNNSFSVYVENDNTYFNEIYNQDDDKLLQRFASQLIDSVEKSTLNKNNLHILISGINLNSDFKTDSYERLISKAELFKHKLQSTDLGFFNEVQFSTDALLRLQSSTEHKNNLYPDFDQIVVRLSDTKDRIENIKNEHNGKNRNFYHLMSKIQFDSFLFVEDLLDTIDYNFIQSQSEYFKSRNLIKSSNAQTILKKSDDLETSLAKWTNNTDKILNTFKNIQEQLASIHQNNDDKESLNSMIEVMDINGVQDSSLLKGLVSLQAGYDNTKARISKIDKDYEKNKKIISLNRSSNLAYNKMLTEFIELMSKEERLLSEEHNQFLLNNMSEYINELKLIYTNMQSILVMNLQNDTGEIPNYINNINKADKTLSEFENRVIAISEIMKKNYQESEQNRSNILSTSNVLTQTGDDENSVASNEIINDLKLLPVEKDLYNREDNIKNALKNIITLSDLIRENNSVYEKINNINQATETIDNNFKQIKLNVEPIIVSDNALSQSNSGIDNLYSAPQYGIHNSPSR